MMSPFLKSHRNRIIFFLFFLTILFLFQTAVSYTLSTYRTQIIEYIHKAFGCRLIYEKLSFNLFRGFYLNNSAVFYNNEEKAPIFIKDAYISIKIIPIFLGRIVLGKIRINEALFLVKKESEGYNLQIMFSDIYKKISESNALKLNIITNRVSIVIDSAKIIYLENPDPERNTYILLKNARIEQRLDKFKFNSNLQFNYRLSQDMYLWRFFRNKHVQQDMKCAVQGTIKGNNLNMDLISLVIGEEQLLGMGINKGFAERNPYIEITFIPSTISLHNIAFIKDEFDSQGTIFVSLKLIGLADNIRTFIAGYLDNCYFRYTLPDGEVFSLKNLSGKLEYRDTQVKLNNGYLELNALPLNFNLETAIVYEPDVVFTVSLPRQFLSFQKLSLEKLEAGFNGKIRNKAFVGNLEIKALYLRKGLNLDMRAYLKNIEFDYFSLKEKYLRAEAMELTKISLDKTQKLNFINLESRICLSKNKIETKGLNFKGYDGILKGRINLDMADKILLKTALSGEGLDVKTLMEDINISDKLFSGKMNMNVIFNNQSEGFLEGRSDISNGRVNLGILADILQLPSLKNTDFKALRAYFSITKDIVKIRKIKLATADIRFDGRWNATNKIEGLLNLKISSTLLNQSIPFRKLLHLTKIKKPYIDFSFLIGGLPKAVRVMWKKGEFREKIRQELPGWVLRSIENNLDKIIDEL